LLEPDQLGVVEQRHARERGRKPLDDRIEHVLRDTLALLRALRRARLEGTTREALAPELIAGERGEPDVILRIVARVRRVAHVIRDAPASAELHGAHPDEIHLGVIDAAVGLFDDGAGVATPAKIAGKRKPDWTGTDDEDRNGHAG